MPVLAGCIVRAAKPEDAVAAASLLRESIALLCAADHQNHGETLERWLSNKTPEQFLLWLAEPTSCTVVAEAGSVLCGVGRIHGEGDVRLCYVRVGWQRAGVGSAVLEALEAQAARWGLREVHLTSSIGARSFYERHGYRPSAPPFVAFGVLRSYPYSKPLR